MLVSEGTDLLHKLFSERTPVSAMFFSAGGDKSRLRGFVSGFTADIELVISETLEPGDAARISVPLANRSYDLRFGDRREFAPPGDPESTVESDALLATIDCYQLTAQAGQQISVAIAGTKNDAVFAVFAPGWKAS